jgi:dihydroxyacetone kinase phosphoprotein-dependent L subunit
VHSIPNAGSGVLVAQLADAIVANKAYLSHIDGKIGDGDHGINMAKGFARAAERISNRETSLSEAMFELSDVLMSEIGGSMGPLYGMMFMNMAEAINDKLDIDADGFAGMIGAGLDGILAIGSAAKGDKTMLDTLLPAVEAFKASLHSDGDFATALSAMKNAAEAGRDSTLDMVAKIGRASRLGERSRGVLDAGATSCCIILSTLADEIEARLAR